MSDPNGPNSDFAILDHLEHAVRALANAVPFVAGQLLTSWRPGLHGQWPNSVQWGGPPGNCPEIFLHGLLV